MSTTARAWHRDYPSHWQAQARALRLRRSPSLSCVQVVTVVLYARMRDRVIQFINTYKYVYLPKSGNIVAVVDRTGLSGIIDASGHGHHVLHP